MKKILILGMFYLSFLSYSCTVDQIDEPLKVEQNLSNKDQSNIDLKSVVKNDNSKFSLHLVGLNEHENVLTSENLTTNNVGTYHNTLLDNFILEAPSVESKDQIVQWYTEVFQDSPSIVETIDLDGSGAQYYSSEELKYIHRMIYAIRAGHHVNDLNIMLENIKIEYYATIFDQSRRDLLDIGLSIGKSSYLYWAPENLGGQGMYEQWDSRREYYNKFNPNTSYSNTSRDESDPELCECCQNICPIDNCSCAPGGGGNGDGGDGGGGWGAYWAWVASADMIGGLKGAGTVAYGAAVAASTGVGAPAAGAAVVSAGLYGAAFTSTLAAITTDHP